MLPEVSVVVLNYNGRPWLRPCLDALAAQQRPPFFETILVDNGSTDGSAELVRKNYPDVRLAETGANLGFAAGNNAGAAAARGRWLAFLNNDTVPAADWIHRLWSAVTDRPEYGLMTSRIVFMDDPSVLDSAGDGYLRAGGAFKHGHRQSVERWMQSREVFGACGAAFMIRRDLFEALGGFDESFFMVYEDVDLSYRARLRGERCWYVADAVVRHAGSATLGRVSAAAVYHGQRNLEWTWLKNTPSLRRSLPGHVVYSVAGLLHYVRAGRGGPAIRGKLAALAALPRVVRERRRIQASRAVATAELARHFTKGWVSRKRAEKR